MSQTDSLRAEQVTRVVSVSLGSSKRDHAVTVEMLGRKLSIERIGVDGDFDRAREMIRELDGHVAAMGLGGTDLYFVAGKRRYVVEESRRLVEFARETPVVDGSGLKNTLERETIRLLVERGQMELAGKNVLVVCAVDRFGMAEAFVEADAVTYFGDLIFVLGLPVPIKTLRGLSVLAFLLLPLIRRLPIKLLYPMGEAQEQTKPKHGKWFQWAEIIAGDFHLIRRNLPEDLTGKTIVTNTTTAADVELLKARGVKRLVTTTPELNGRSFGTNVMEAVLVALSGKRPDDMEPEDYLGMLHELGWEPRIADL